MADEEILSKRRKCRIFLVTYWRVILFFTLPVVLFPIMSPEFHKSNKCMYVVVLMATYWVTNLIPIYVTALIPVALFPILGIMDTDTTCRLYLKDSVIFFLGGIILALSIQYSNLHTRIALAVVSCFGCRIKRLHVGLIVVTTLISNWQSNTATTAMMCPIVKAILQEFERVGLCTLFKRKDTGEPIIPPLGEVTTFNGDTMHCTHIPTAFYCSVAFASTIGGLGTIMASGTNMVLKGVIESTFPEGPGLNFANFMMYFFPVMLVIVTFAEIWMLCYFFGLCRPNSESARRTQIGKEGEDLISIVLRKRYQELGPMNSHEIVVAIFFVLAVGFVFTRKPGIFTGWASVYPFKEVAVRDATALYSVLILLFIVPATYNCLDIYRAQTISDLPTRPITVMNWHYINKNAPWGLVFLLGGGYAIAEGGRVSGMSEEVGRFLSRIGSFPPIIILAIVLAITNFLTEFTANVPTANVILPIVAQMAIAKQINPLYLVLPTAVSCAMTFITAVGTPPNALVVNYAGLRLIDLAKAGLRCKLVSYFTCLLFCPIWGLLLYRDLYEFPEWANVSSSSDRLYRM